MNITLLNKTDEIGLSTFKLDLVLPRIEYHHYKNTYNEHEIIIDFSTTARYFKDIDMFEVNLTFFGLGFTILSQWSY